MEWYQGEGDSEPPLEDDTLIPHVKTLATWENRSRVTGLGDRGQHERTEVSTALELILDRQTATSAQVLRPLLVELSFQIESAFLVVDVTRGNEEGETDPQQEGVPGEETAVVEENASPADEGGYDAQRGGNSGNDKFLRISDSDYVGSIPNMEPREQAENEGNQGVDRQLQNGCSAAEREGDESWSHKNISNEHNPLELGPSESGLLRTVPEPGTLHTVVVFVVGTRHTRFVGFEGFTATTLFAHS